MELAKEIAKSKSLLIVVPKAKLAKERLEIAKALLGKSVGYVTTKKSFFFLKKFFEKNNISLKEFVFADSVSRKKKNCPLMAEGCYFIDPKNAVQETILKSLSFLRHGFGFIVFDSIDGYKNKKDLLKELPFFFEKLKETKARAVFLSADKKLAGEFGKIVEKTVAG